VITGILRQARAAEPPRHLAVEPDELAADLPADLTSLPESAEPPAS
jgi:hypothetical protein